MLVIVDANEVFSLLIKGTTKSEAILFSNTIELIAPEFLLDEFSKNKEEILTKSHRSRDEFFRLLSIFERRIELVPKEEFKNFIPRVLELFPEHTKDFPYLALALKFNCPLWSEEKLLKRQSVVKILNTKELFELLKSKL